MPKSTKIPRATRADFERLDEIIKYLDRLEKRLVRVGKRFGLKEI